jgi:hypothetical protein
LKVEKGPSFGNRQTGITAPQLSTATSTWFSFSCEVANRKHKALFDHI